MYQWPSGKKAGLDIYNGRLQTDFAVLLPSWHHKMHMFSHVHYSAKSPYKNLHSRQPQSLIKHIRTCKFRITTASMLTLALCHPSVRSTWIRQLILFWNFAIKRLHPHYLHQLKSGSSFLPRRRHPSDCAGQSSTWAMEHLRLDRAVSPWSPSRLLNCCSHDQSITSRTSAPYDQTTACNHAVTIILHCKSVYQTCSWLYPPFGISSLLNQEEHFGRGIARAPCTWGWVEDLAGAAHFRTDSKGSLDQDDADWRNWTRSTA